MPTLPTPADATPVYDVFISYHRATHLAEADWLHRVLTAQGLHVFKDDQNLRVSQRWQEELGRALQTCRRFAVLLGSRGLERWVGAETEIALSRYFGAHAPSQRPQIVPVLLPGAPALDTLPFLGLLQGVAWPAGEAPPTALVAAFTQTETTAKLPAQALLPPEVCPYVGLAPFQQTQARLFFGREQDVLAALGRLGRESPSALGWANGGAAEGTLTGPVGSMAPYKRWLNVVGGSGSGKSSLLRAGLLPLMAQGALSARTGIHIWHMTAPMLPGRDPLVPLAEVLAEALHGDEEALLQKLRTGEPESLRLWLRKALRDLTPAANEPQGVLLPIDQFEELFTLAEPTARTRLDVLLAEALAVPGGPLHLVSTCRSDYQHRIAEDLPRLAALLNTQASTYTLTPMQRDGLALAITEPARLGRVTVQPALLQALLDDASQDLAAALPLVQHALETLWHRQRAQPGAATPLVLPLADYEACGRLGGILATEADRLLLQLDGGEGGKPCKGALELLLALSHYHAEGRHTRQSLTWVQAQRQAGQGLKAADLARGEAVLNQLSGQRGTGPQAEQARLRLITVDGSQHAPAADAAGDTRRVDLIHEALLRSRPATQPGQAAQPYWPRLVAYLTQHKGKDVLRQQLRLEAEGWPTQGRWARLMNAPSWLTLRRYRALRLLASPQEQAYLRSARRSMVASWIPVAGLFSSLFMGSSLYGLAQSQTHALLSSPAVQDRLNAWRWSGSTAAPYPQTASLLPFRPFTYGCQPGRDVATDEKCSEDEAQHEVDLGQTPQPCTDMAIHTVTFEQYDYYVWQQRQSHPAQAPDYPSATGWGWQRGTLPVVNVSHRDAVAYTRWLSAATGQSWRLPTEQEWEYAARAPGRAGSQSGRYWWGDEDPRQHRHANCRGCAGGVGGLAPVGSYGANAFGLYDMAGNVWQWTQSVYTEDNRPFKGTSTEEDKADNEVGRVLRGGSWFNYPASLRTAFRYRNPFLDGFDFVGFRVCRASPI